MMSPKKLKPFLYALPALRDNYIYMICCPITHKIISVDPGESRPVLDFLQDNNVSLDAIFLTHHHYDHTDGVKDLVRQFPQVEVYGSPKTQAYKPLLTKYVTESMPFSIGALQFKILELPGHTQDHIGYYEVRKNFLLCGDTLFHLGCGRNFEGNPLDLYSSLQKIQKLPQETLLFAAHEYTLHNLTFCQSYFSKTHDFSPIEKKIRQSLKTQGCSFPTTLTEQNRFNPFLNTHQEWVQKALHKETPQEAFLHLRALKDRF